MPDVADRNQERSALAALAALALLVAGCSCGEAMGPGRDAAVDARTGEDDAFVPEADALVPVDAGPRCEPACGAGAACVEGACVDDCRLALAMACDAGRVCSETSGRCVLPGEDCTPAGGFVPCGTREFPPTCGPGAQCDPAIGACVAAAGCTSVACDVAGVCRGIGCSGAGTGSGSVSAIALDPIADAPRAAPDAVVVRGRVSGTGICALTVTLELRIETEVFVSAYNDSTIWQVDLVTGARTAWATGITSVNGLATDPTGALYVLEDCVVGRVSDAVRTFTPIATVPTGGCSRLAIGPDGALYVSSTLEAWRVDPFTGASASYGSIPAGIAAWGGTFLTGLGFLDDGSLVLGEHWPSLRRVPPGGGPSEAWADAPPRGLTATDNPWNEGMAIAPDGLLHVGVFPSNSAAGFVYRVEADRSSTVVADLATIRAGVPATGHAGIHGIAFGLDGAMYFTNQNTSGATFEPLGQLLVMRAAGGAISLLASGFNFDWPRGYDGDLVVGTRSVETITVPVASDGSFEARLDAPDVDGAFEVRASVIDPATGLARAARRAARTL